MTSTNTSDTINALEQGYRASSPEDGFETSNLETSSNPDEEEGTAVIPTKEFTPLFVAAYGGVFNTVKKLIARGADTNDCLSDGTTVLMVAAIKGVHKICLHLIENGANVEAQNHDGFTALYVAAQAGSYDVVTLLLSKGATAGLANSAGNTPLMAAVRGGFAAITQALLESTCDPSQKNDHGLVALHKAALGSRLDLTELLLKAGTPVDIRDAIEQTPLLMAAAMGCVDVVDCLLNNGADPNGCNKNRSFPLYLASQEGKVEVVKRLLDGGAEINQTTNDKITPLMIAIINDRVEVTKTLLERGADLTCVNLNGTTALMFSVRSLPCLKALLEYGADATLGDLEGWTALHYAAEVNSPAGILCTLINAGANLSAVTNYGQTAANVASAKGHTAATELLTALASRPRAPQPIGPRPGPKSPNAQAMTAPSNTVAAPAAAIDGSDSGSDAGEKQSSLASEPLPMNASMRAMTADGEEESVEEKRSMLALYAAPSISLSEVPTSLHSMVSYVSATALEQETATVLIEEVREEVRAPMYSVPDSRLDSHDRDQELSGNEDGVAALAVDEGAILEEKPASLENEETQRSAKRTAACNACGTETHRRCAGCKCTYFCSKTCQKSAYSAHKRVCAELREERLQAKIKRVAEKFVEREAGIV